MHKHIFSVLVQNEPGVLAHIAGMFAARGFNIDSLVVGRTEDPEFSHMIIVSTGDDLTMEQIRKQLGKIITVVKVRDVSEQDCVQRDLLLIRVHCPPEKRGEVRQITAIFRASIVDVGPRSLLIQLTGPEEKIEAFVELCRPYGIKQLSRTGVIAIPRDTPHNEAVVGPPQVRRSRTRTLVSTAKVDPMAAALPPS